MAPVTKKQKKLRLEAGGPVRSCIVCRRPQAKQELWRLVRGPSGLVFDPGFTAPGRGYYLCRRPACREALLTGRRRFARLPAGIRLEEASRLELEKLGGRTDRSDVDQDLLEDCK